MKKFNITTSLLLFIIISVTASAQKLPGVQKVSLHAPANIKIDGKTTEWDNQFQAYNHATDVFYTVSNDNNNLYLAVQATDPAIINKIIGGGITFTIQKSGKKNDKDGVSITYPIFDNQNRPYLRNGAGGPRRVQVISNGGGDIQVFKSGGDDTPVKIQGDSAMQANNKRLGDNSKYIGVTGIKGLDTLISVYNQDGIKTGEAFDTKMAYTYELAISLKQLGLSVNDAAKFAYHVTLNGGSMFNKMVFKAIGTPDGGGTVSITSPDNPLLSLKIGLDNGQSSPTDFWGEYVLAK